MKDIKYNWVLLVVIILIIPQITLAAWWNPLTWFNNWGFIFNKTNNQTQILEKRIEEELERKLDNVATSTNATTTKILVSDQKQTNNQTPEKSNPPESSTPTKQTLVPSDTDSVLSKTIPIQSSAILTARINPNEYVTNESWFEYGTNPSQLNIISQHNTFKLNDNVFQSGKIVTNSISDLTANTTYYFRAVTSGSYGKKYGNILSFTTNDRIPVNAGTSTVSVQDTELGIKNLETIVAPPKADDGTCRNEDDRERFIEWSLPLSYNPYTPNIIDIKKFDVSIDVNGAKATVSIPGVKKFLDKYTVTYKIKYWAHDGLNPNFYSEYVVKNTLPFSFELPKELLEREILFRFSIGYKCFDYFNDPSRFTIDIIKNL